MSDPKNSREEAFFTGIELFSLVVFVILFTRMDLYAASAGMILVMTLGFLVARFMKFEIKPQKWWSFWAMFFLGGLSLVFQNEMFIKWKPTVVNFLISLALGGSHFSSKGTILEGALRGLKAPSLKLRRLNAITSVYFLSLGFLNIAAAFWLSTTQWVTFKIAGVFFFHGLFMVFVLYYLWAYVKPFLKEKDRYR